MKVWLLYTLQTSLVRNYQFIRLQQQEHNVNFGACNPWSYGLQLWLLCTLHLTKQWLVFRQFVYKIHPQHQKNSFIISTIHTYVYSDSTRYNIKFSCEFSLWSIGVGSPLSPKALDHIHKSPVVLHSSLSSSCLLFLLLLRVNLWKHFNMIPTPLITGIFYFWRLTLNFTSACKRSVHFSYTTNTKVYYTLINDHHAH